MPAAYLGVHLVYEVESYFPRHIIAGHLAMAISLCLVLAPPGDATWTRRELRWRRTGRHAKALADAPSSLVAAPEAAR